jgi:hypothetical protein
LKISYSDRFNIFVNIICLHTRLQKCDRTPKHSVFCSQLSMKFGYFSSWHTNACRLRSCLIYDHFIDHTFFKCKSKLIEINPELDNYFCFSQGRSRRSQSGFYLKIQSSKTNTFRDFYFNRIVIMWNSIPDDIKTCQSISSFKRTLFITNA